jgi:hypothetical protein
MILTRTTRTGQSGIAGTALPNRLKSAFPLAKFSPEAIIAL